MTHGAFHTCASVHKGIHVQIFLYVKNEYVHLYAPNKEITIYIYIHQTRVRQELDYNESQASYSDFLNLQPLCLQPDFPSLAASRGPKDPKYHLQWRP